MNKLELNWIGKYDKENVINPEPRILVENEEYSYKKDVEIDDENGKIMKITRISK